jgi:hypothetical protein
MRPGLLFKEAPRSLDRDPPRPRRPGLIGRDCGRGTAFVGAGTEDRRPVGRHNGVSGYRPGKRLQTRENARPALGRRHGVFRRSAVFLARQRHRRIIAAGVPGLPLMPWAPDSAKDMGMGMREIFDSHRHVLL